MGAGSNSQGFIQNQGQSQGQVQNQNQGQGQRHVIYQVQGAPVPNQVFIQQQGVPIPPNQPFNQMQAQPHHVLSNSVNVRGGQTNVNVSSNSINNSQVAIVAQERHGASQVRSQILEDARMVTSPMVGGGNDSQGFGMGSSQGLGQSQGQSNVFFNSYAQQQPRPQ